ncbi:MAG TPA: O-antigen ligase family protein [Atribacterota bacterium]|nr:O-antigen ligase family protein [Atribacterota bacterium]
MGESKYLYSNTVTNKKISSDTVKFFFIKILFFLILFAPTVLQEIKAIILIIITGIVVLETITRMKISIHPKILVWVLIFFATNFIFLLRGTYGRGDIFFMLAPSYIIWPIVYAITLIVSSSRFKAFDMTKLFIISTIVISCYILYINLNFMGYVPDSFILLLPLNYRINYNFGYINFFTPSITSLFFLIPYIIAMLVNYKHGMTVKKKHLWIALFLGIAVSVLIGRRALIGIVCMSPFIALFWSKHKLFISKSTTKKIFTGIVVVFLIIIAYFSIGNLMNVGLRIDNTDTELIKSGTQARYSQFDALIQGWKEKPLFGSGFGVNAKGSIRSTSVPGAYELSYAAMLFQTGIIGMAVYFLLIVWLFSMCVKILKSDKESITYIIPTLTGVIGMLIANATNPYIQSFDGLWIFFYPLALINRYLLTKVKNVGGQ